MLRSLKSAMLFSGALFFGTSLGASSSISPAHADALLNLPSSSMQPVDESPPPPDDPKRKKAGEPCKSADECQRHHSCVKDGDKNVCKAPPRARLPPGAVT